MKCPKCKTKMFVKKTSPEQDICVCLNKKCNYWEIKKIRWTREHDLSTGKTKKVNIYEGRHFK